MLANVSLLGIGLYGLASLSLKRRSRKQLNAVIDALLEIGEGNFEVQLEPVQRGPLGDLQRAVIEMAQRLRSARQEPENQAATGTGPLQSVEEAEQESDEGRRRLIARGNALIEEERRRIAMEIHDHLNASLLFVKLEAQRVATLASTLPPSKDAEEIETVAQRISVTTADLYNAARNIIRQLRPEVIDILGLKGALQEMIRHYDQADPNCRFSLRVEPGFPNLNPQLTMAAYRVTQEAVSNVVKHAGASHCTVTLWRNQMPGTVCVAIEDDGVGFNPKKRTATGIGLIGMRERATAVGGSIKIRSAPGAGTRVAIELPTQKP